MVNYIKYFTGTHMKSQLINYAMMPNT